MRQLTKDVAQTVERTIVLIDIFKVCLERTVASMQCNTAFNQLFSGRTAGTDIDDVPEKASIAFDGRKSVWMNRTDHQKHMLETPSSPQFNLAGLFAISGYSGKASGRFFRPF